MANNTKWPFAGMKIGDVVTFSMATEGIQRYVYTYAYGAKKKFKTWHDENGKLHVERIW